MASKVPSFGQVSSERESSWPEECLLWRVSGLVTLIMIACSLLLLLPPIILFFAFFSLFSTLLLYLLPSHLQASENDGLHLSCAQHSGAPALLQSLSTAVLIATMLERYRGKKSELTDISGWCIHNNPSYSNYKKGSIKTVATKMKQFQISFIWSFWSCFLKH